MSCPEHPLYRGEAVPREDHPKGGLCENCWLVWIRGALTREEKWWRAQEFFQAIEREAWSEEAR